MKLLSNTKKTAFALTTALALALTAGTGNARAASPTEGALIATINSATATDNDKVTAAQDLGHIGTPNAIAPLVALLNSDKAHLRHAARYALENNPSPTIEDVLLEAASRLTGAARVGVVQSLGNRGTDKSVPLLAKLAPATDDAALAAAATTSLAKIATPAAFAALKPGLGKCPAAAAAYLRAADRYAKKNAAAAAAYYRDLDAVTANILYSIKQGALRGVVLTGGKSGLARWEKAIASTDANDVEAALRVVAEYPVCCGDATTTFAGALAKLPDATQIRLSELLAVRGDKAAAGALAQLTTHDNEQVSFAAARALVPLGGAATAEKAFNLLLASKNASVAIAAREALRGLSYQTPAAETAAGFKSLFNGKDLTEWRGGDGWWTVSNGILTAESTAEKPCKKNSHLIWNGGEKGDFELRAEFRLSRSANSGIQFRAEDKNADTSYQADMNGTGEYIGFLYHPGFHLVGKRGASVVLRGKGKIKETPFANAKVLPQHIYKLGTWSEYKIVAKGKHITLYVNGIKTNEFQDERPNAPAKGVITLQMHAGPPMKIEYRNLRIRDL
jgi:HEAT repeat protein